MKLKAYFQCEKPSNVGKDSTIVEFTTPFVAGRGIKVEAKIKCSHCLKFMDPGEEAEEAEPAAVVPHPAPAPVEPNFAEMLKAALAPLQAAVVKLTAEIDPIKRKVETLAQGGGLSKGTTFRDQKKIRNEIARVAAC